jgi:hypothetical protein
MSTLLRQTLRNRAVFILLLFLVPVVAFSALSPLAAASAPARGSEKAAVAGSSVAPITRGSDLPAETTPTSAALTDTPAFEDSGIVLPGTWQGTAAWGDYDGDGDLDIAMTSGYAFSEIFRNDGGGVFTDVDAGLVTVNAGSVAWGDYDQDGDLDLLLSGSDNDNLPISRIYRNDGGDTFTDIDAGLIGLWNFLVTTWGDYDNDGDLDALLAGQTGSDESIAKLYRNDGHDTFTDAGVELLREGEAMFSMAWGDYDNDDDLDMLYSASDVSSPSGSVTRVYRNESGAFSDAGILLEGVNQSAVAWGDYDNDGDLDVLLVGWSNELSEVTRIYRNEGGGVFTNIDAALTNLARNPSAAWGDYDNDGDLDVLLRGCAVWDNHMGFCYHHVTQIYRNDSGEFAELDVTLPSTSEDAVGWGDYDNDGDLDVLVTGDDATRIFRNNTKDANTVPSAPHSLSVSLIDGVRFEWQAANDVETAAPGLHYALRVGTASGGTDVVAPLATPGGYRQVVEWGNAQHGLSAHVKSLPPGTYYWSVQAIDGAFAGSAFAAESSFTLHGAFPVYLPVFLP